MKFNRMELNAFDPDGVGVDNGTYFGLPFEPGTAELVLVSAPWDVTVSYGAGTAHAPDAVMEASTQLDFHEPLAPGVWRRGIATADVDYALLEESQRLRSDAEKVIAHLEGGGSPEDDYAVRKVRRINEGCRAMNANIGAQAARWLDAGKTVGLVGGDHSTPYGLIRALGDRHGEFGILHIDAHCDLRDAYEGFEFSHASIMFNVLRDVPSVKKSPRSQCAISAGRKPPWPLLPPVLPPSTTCRSPPRCSAARPGTRCAGESWMRCRRRFT